MEKITVKIGVPGGTSVNREQVPDLACIKWLSRVLEISFNHAQTIVNRLRKSGKNCKSSYVTLDMNYRQLARYTVIRKTEQLGEYWKYPHIEEFIEDNQIPDCDVIEVRPSYRPDY